MTSTIDRTAAGAQDAGAQGDDGTAVRACGWAYFGGELVPFEKATLSIATHALNYGTAIFEGIRAYRQADGGLAVLLAREHYDRLLRNGRLLRASVRETSEELVAVTAELLTRHGTAEDLYIRPLLYKAAHSLRLQLSGLDDRIGIYAFPMGGYLDTGGLRVSVSAWQRVNDNAIPARGKVTGSYVNACMAVEDAHSGGFQETVLLTADGHVAEASSANVFVVRDGELVTPPLSDDVLPGITRGAVITLARDAGYAVTERSIDRTELYLADEVFLTGTGAQVAPVASVDGRPVGDASTPVGLDLQARYFAAVRGTDERYAGWLTRIAL
ncbi:MAG: branched-chain amino acid transaminase [Candidatus Limnocylindria bacterium]